MRQLDPGSGKTRQAYLRAYRFGIHDNGPPIVVFHYQTSRAGTHARPFLHDWLGDLTVGDYAGYFAAKVMLALARRIGVSAAASAK